MPEETLLSAARRVSRFTKIDEAHGGFTSTETHIALIALAKEIERETVRQKAAEAHARVEPEASAA